MFDRLVLMFYSVDSIENWEVFLHTTENRNRTHAIFSQFVLWCCQVIIMMRKHDAVSRLQLYSQ